MLIQMNTKPMPQEKFADSRDVEAALYRAEQAALEVAKLYNISIAIKKDERLVELVVV